MLLKLLCSKITQTQYHYPASRCSLYTAMNFILSAILFGNVLSISTFSHIKKIFNTEIHKLFQNISIHAHNISIRQSPELASILIFDTTGIVPQVRENNPKFIHLLLKNTSKANPQLSSWQNLLSCLFFFA